MNTWFECTAKYIKMDENGHEKKASETYMLDAISFTEAESRIYKELQTMVSGEFMVSKISKTRISEIIPSDNGDRWYKAHEWSNIKKTWRGPGLVGQDYVKAIQSARICLGLLSKDNRDLHTQRSSEIPYIGSVLCAERTGEHQAMYRENEEALFWDTPEECAHNCFTLLADEPRRQTIACAGQQRCIQSGYLNERIIKGILDSLSVLKGASSGRQQK